MCPCNTKQSIWTLHHPTSLQIHTFTCFICYLRPRICAQEKKRLHPSAPMQCCCFFLALCRCSASSCFHLCLYCSISTYYNTLQKTNNALNRVIGKILYVFLNMNSVSSCSQQGQYQQILPFFNCLSKLMFTLGSIFISFECCMSLSKFWHYDQILLRLRNNKIIRFFQRMVCLLFLKADGPLPQVSGTILLGFKIIHCHV